MCNFTHMAGEKKVRGLKGSAAKEEVPLAMTLMPSRVVAARKGRGLKQDDLAALAGVSQTSVSNMETGASLDGVRLVSAVRIATALKMSLDEMVLGIPNLYVQLATALAEGRINPTDVVPTEKALVSAPVPGAAPDTKPRKKRRQRHQ